MVFAGKLCNDVNCSQKSWNIFQAAGQSAIVNTTLDEIKKFEDSTLTTLSRYFKVLRGGVSAYFTRSQNTLIVSRQSLFSTALDFPYHQLSDETRQNLVKMLASVLTSCIDPTVEHLRSETTFVYFNFTQSASSPIENALKDFRSQLNVLTNSVKTATEDCLMQIDVKSGSLTSTYNPLTNAINACSRYATASNRLPLLEFTRLHYAALNMVNRMNLDLNLCGNGNKKEECVLNYLKENCVKDLCKVCTALWDF